MQAIWNRYSQLVSAGIGRGDRPVISSKAAIGGQTPKRYRRWQEGDRPPSATAGGDKGTDPYMSKKQRGREGNVTTTAKIDSGIEDFKNDLGKPWRYEEDGYTVTRACAWSAAGLPSGGMRRQALRDKDGKLVKVEGDPDQTRITQGRLCMPLPDASPTTSIIRTALLYPMKRAKEDRGKDKWERITWDEAYDIIEENIRASSRTSTAPSPSSSSVAPAARAARCAAPTARP